MYVDDLVLDGRPEPFDEDPGWAGRGNRARLDDDGLEAAQKFGYSRTAFAGGERGELGGRISPTAPASSGSALAGKTFVITGTLPTLSREEATARIEAAGGRASGSVSKKTHYVLAGEEAGSKLEKAKALGVPVIDEAEFLRMVGG